MLSESTQMDRIPICHIQCLPLVAGAQRAMLHILDLLDRDRYAPSVICQGPGPLVEALRERDIPCHFASSLVRPIRPHHDIRGYYQLKKLLRSLQPKIVHTHSSKPGILGRLAASAVQVPHIVHHVHGYAFHEFSPAAVKWAYHRLESLAAQHCHRMVFVNDEERQMSVQQGWVRSEQALTIHNGIPTREFQSPELRDEAIMLRASWGLAPEDILILFVGRLDRQKQPLILPAIAQALRQHSTQRRWMLAVVGDGPQQATLQRDVEAAGLGDCVRLMGWMPQPQAAYTAADLMLLPSLWEGMPLVLCEALAAGTPCVVSDIKGNREIVRSSVGTLCPPRDADAYAKSLACLINSPLLRSQMAAAGRALAMRSFDVHTNMGKVIDLYEDLLGRTPERVRRAA